MKPKNEIIIKNNKVQKKVPKKTWFSLLSKLPNERYMLDAIKIKDADFNIESIGILLINRE